VAWGVASASTWQAGEKIAPDLAARLNTAQAGERVPVILRLVEQADLQHLPSVRGETRAARQVRVIRALRGVADAGQAGLRRALAGEAGRRAGPVTYFWIFNGAAFDATPDLIQELAARGDVAALELDRPFAIPAVYPASGSPEPNLDLVNAPAVWAQGYRGFGTVVASMDTGVDYTHPDLSINWRGGSNSWYDPNGQHALPYDGQGHGTETMGVIVGQTTGLAPEARWIAVKMFDDSGRSSDRIVHLGFQRLLDPDGNPTTPDAPNIVNNSWVRGATGCDLAIQPDLQALRAAGIVPVFAAGNTGIPDDTAETFSPANNPGALAGGQRTKRTTCGSSVPGGRLPAASHIASSRRWWRPA
jgi:subtilisin family serine protease